MEYHKPVLYDEVLENIIKDTDSIYLDCTLGGGGHTEGILEKSTDKSIVLAIDQDEEAISYASKRLEKYGDKLKIFRNNFKNMDLVIYMAGHDKVDGILMDIGVSSKQLDDPERGFSYKYTSKLDMRMNNELEISAYDVINTFSEKEIADILFKYGEEPRSRKISKYIVDYRKEKKIETTTELSEIVIRSIGKSMKRHPAKRTFQAIRIFVNKELEVLEEALDKAINCLKPNGRLLVISFHSLEDRIVKEKFKDFANPCRHQNELPFQTCELESLGKIITKKPLIAKLEELKENKRAHSAKLRVFEKR